MAEVGSAFVSIVPSAKGFGKTLDSDIGPQLDKSGKSGGQRLGSGIGSTFGKTLKSAIGPALGVLSTAGLIAGVKDAIGEAREAQKVGALTVNTIKTTGGAAKVTAKQVGALASAISAKAGIDDEAIQSGANLILTFKNVRNEVGKGAKIFDRATQAAVDLSAAGFGDLSGTSKQLGKALNDPIKGLAALGKSGVTFSEAQKKQIKGFVQANDLLSAQKIILGEVESQVGGAAAATATSGEKARVAFGNLQETIGTALLPAIDKLSVKLTNDIIPAVSEFVTGMQDGTGAGGKVAAVLGDIFEAGKTVATVVGKVVTTFSEFPGATQKVLLLAGAALLLKSRFGDSIPSLQSFSRESVTAATKSLAIRGGALAAGAALATLASKAGGASTDLGALATVGAGIATGFAVAGPWGAAIGGGAGLLSVFTSRSSAAAAAQREFDTAGKAVAATLNQQTGALEKTTRATAAKSLADAGAFDAASKVGVSYKTVLDAALGNESAIRRVDAATRTYLLSQKGNISSATKAAKVVSTLGNSVHSTAGEIDNERKKIDQVNKSMANAKDKIVKFTVKTSIPAGIGAFGSGSTKRSKVGKNAKGTNNWRGGMTWVGERGPELINLAKGAQVIPNNKIGDVSASAGAGGSSLDARAIANALAVALDGMQFDLNADNRYLKTRVRQG